MLFNPKHQDHLERLADRLRLAPALTSDLITDVVANACTRIPVLGKAGKAVRINQLIAAGAWGDAALALIELELPAWKLRRILHEDGEWFCSLSREPRLPLGLDDTADARHEVLPLALLGAFVEARRRTSNMRETGAPRVPRCSPSTGPCGLLRQFRVSPTIGQPKTRGALGSACAMNARQTRPPTRRARRSRSELLFATLVIAILGLAVLVCVGLIAPILWAALVESTQPKAQACDSIKHESERAACAERQRDQTAAHPAKGAIAPPVAPGPGR